MEVNVARLRDIAADVLAYPVESMVRNSDAFNFSFKNDYSPVVNPYQISAGSLPSLSVVNAEFNIPYVLAFDTTELTSQTVTYADIVSRLGIQRGDQLTFIQISHDASKTEHETDLITGFRFARVIMEPSDGDMSSPFINQNTINKPNAKNSGSFKVLQISTAEGTNGLTFRLQDIATPGSSIERDRELIGSAVILSRQSGSKWLRSTQFIVVKATEAGPVLKNSTLGLAYDTYRLGAASDLYLNQAE